MGVRTKTSFKPGNQMQRLKQPEGDKITPFDEAVELRRMEYPRVLKRICNMSQMPLSEFKRQLELSDDRTSLEDAAFFALFRKMMEGDMPALKLYLTLRGIPTEFKAVAVQDMDHLAKPKEVDEDNTLSKNEKLTMLDKMKSIIESLD